jgi:hypothetical protein
MNRNRERALAASAAKRNAKTLADKYIMADDQRADQETPKKAPAGGEAKVIKFGSLKSKPIDDDFDDGIGHDFDDAIDDDLDLTAYDHCATAREYVRLWLRNHNYEFRFNGDLVRSGEKYVPPKTHADVETAISKRRVHIKTILADLIDDRPMKADENGDDTKAPKWGKKVIEDAFFSISARERWKRAVAIRTAVFRPLSVQQQKRAGAQWERLAAIFDIAEPMLGVATVKDFMWQVGRKAAAMPIADPHVIIFVSDQHFGKTYLTLLMLGAVAGPDGHPPVVPIINELTAYVDIDDYVSSKHEELHSYSVIFVDDADRADATKLGRFKKLVTSNKANVRVLGTGRLQEVPLEGVVVINSNLASAELFPDPTGNRRFVELTLKNCNPKAGGDPALWEILTTTDWHLLWRSINLVGESPLAEYRDALKKHQDASMPIDAVEQWARDIDPKRLIDITTDKGVPAHKLLEMFNADTHSRENVKSWGAKMNIYAGRPGIIFGRKVKTWKGWFYPIVKSHNS